ncbi:hypothetical protein CAter10_4219 [Collimonas arenae]|nr:hypothetical protein CAter10_4219 [Collimonas arenae]
MWRLQWSGIDYWIVSKSRCYDTKLASKFASVILNGHHSREHGNPARP